MSTSMPENTQSSDPDVKRIEDSLEKRNITFEALFRLFERIGTTLDMGTIVRLFLLTLMGQLKLKRIALYLVSSCGSRFEVQHAMGVGRQAVPQSFCRVHAFLRWLKKADETLHIDGFFAGASKGVPEETLRFLGDLAERGFSYALPLTDQEEVIGAVFFSGKVTGERFSRFDNELLRMLAKVATITIKNAALYHEAVRSKQELEKFSRIKKEFINHTSHELRTPLTVLKSALWSIDPEAVDDGILVDMSKDAVLRLHSKVEQLLSLNDIELNETAYELVPGDVTSLFEDCLREILPEIEEKQITVDVDDRARYRRTLVDGAKMKLVFRGILENAVNAVERGGVISIETYVTDVPPDEGDGNEMPDWSSAAGEPFMGVVSDNGSGEGAGGIGSRDAGAFRPSSSVPFLVIRIRDDGIGIPADEITSIAEPFRRASNSPLTNVKGLGIGLSVALKIISGHGGRLFCRSVEGEGTEFSIWLLAD